MLKFKSMEEIGIVENIQGKIATVKIPKKTMCEECSLGICKSSEQSMEIEAFNYVDAHVGQRVKVVIKPYSYLKGTLIIYGIPALSLVIGAISGKEIFSAHFKNLDSDAVSAIFGFSALIISFLFIKIWSSLSAKRENLRSFIKEILNDNYIGKV